MLREFDLLSKLAQVIEQIPKDVLYDFCRFYAFQYHCSRQILYFNHFKECLAFFRGQQWIV